VAHRFSLLRSLAHTGPCHDSGPQQLFTGFPITVNRAKPDHPDLFAIVDGLRSDPARALPNNVGIPPIPYLGSAYLGPAHAPFAIYGDPNDPKFEVPNVGVKDPEQLARLGGRVGLRQRLDGLARHADRLAARDAFDDLQGQAWNVLTGPAARRAFDLSTEDPRLRDRYGRHTWGQSCLLARRLAEAGVTFVTVHMGGWDDHANIEGAMKSKLPIYDHALASLVEDLSERGLYERVAVCVCGEFGRTPRVNPQAGRDHWGESGFCLLGGGGLKTGLAVGSTTAKGERPKDRPVRPEDMLATLYHVLGIDATRTFTDRSGRPHPILNGGEPIAELV